MALVIFVFFGCIEPVADRALVPDAVSDGVRLPQILSHELAVDKTWPQDGDVAKHLSVAPESVLTIGTLLYIKKYFYRYDETGRPGPRRR